MAHYQLNCLSDGVIFRCEDFEAEHDDEAVRHALHLRSRTAAELWCGVRMVRRFGQMEELGADLMAVSD